MPVEEFEEFYRQFERRVDAWFEADFDVPPAAQEYPFFKWIERGPKSAWGGTCTCTHSDVGSTVIVPSDEWNGGCTPHEIGHGVLKRLHHPCWRRYEHSRTAPESCK